MITNFCKTVCKECPFNKSSLPGYLGGFTIQETIQTANSEQDFLCHLVGRETNKKQCAGRMLYATKTAKSFRNTELEEIRKEITEINRESYKETILGFDFLKHHKE